MKKPVSITLHIALPFKNRHGDHIIIGDAKLLTHSALPLEVGGVVTLVEASGRINITDSHDLEEKLNGRDIETISFMVDQITDPDSLYPIFHLAETIDDRLASSTYSDVTGHTFTFEKAVACDFRCPDCSEELVFDEPN